MKLKEWLRNQVAGLSIAFSNVEKNLLNQEGKSLSESAGTNQERKHQEGTLADSLMRGEITQEVKNLRWRTYKILQEMEKLTINKVDDDGNAITYQLGKANNSDALSKIRLDKYDDYSLEMVFNNIEIFGGIANAITNELVSSLDYFATNKTEKPLAIERDFFPKFYLENYTKKINIRRISDTNKLIEFYVSKYPDEYNKNTKLFIKELKKIIEDSTYNTNILKMSEIGFITNNTLGADDYLLFTYTNIVFDKIIEFDGHYVIKFTGTVQTNGENILLKYVEPELDKKYETKERKQIIYGGP